MNKIDSILLSIISFKLHKSGRYQSAEITIGDHNVVALKPMVSMNNSGDALSAYLKNKNLDYFIQ